MNSKDNETLLRRLTDLKPTMKLDGRVTKIELFGAFVDVGAEREGLIHISMLKVSNINRVEDVLKEGQDVEVWVHRVNPDAGRLELTMIQPIQLKWKKIKSGMKISGKVVRIENFGAFVDVGAERPGLIHVSELSSDFVSNPTDIVKVGDEVEVSVIAVDRKKKQIRLSMKETFLEVENADDEAEEEPPTAMEFALRQALEQTGEEPGQTQSPTSSVKGEERKELEDILSRTLEQRVRTASSNE